VKVMKQKIILCVLIILGMSACGPDPVDEAKAYKIRTETDTQAAQELAALEQQKRLDDQQYEIDQAIKADQIATQKVILWALTIGIIASLGVLAFHALKAWRVLSAGLARAAVQAAEVRSLLIPMDPVTRSYPLIPVYNGKGLFSVTNANTGDTMLLDTRNEADSRLINMFTRLQLTDIVATKQQGAFRVAGTNVDPNIVLLEDPDGSQQTELT